MTSAPAAQFAAPAPAAMGIYERRHQHHPLAAGVWGDQPFIRPDTTGSSNNNAAAAAALPAAMVVAPPLIEPKFESQHGDEDDAALLESPRHLSDSFDQEASRPRDKIQRRLAQNREAARKSRLRKKAYIQNLETSRMKLAHLEQEITRARQQGVYISSSNPSTLPAPIDSGVVTFEVEYAQWVEEQGRQTAELRAALQARRAAEPELRVLVEAALAHYDKLFTAKREAARRDVFFVMSGVWRTGAERFFLWIAGFRPSEVIRVLSPQLEPMTERQAADVQGLQQKARHLEDALSQGMDKLKQTLADSLLAEAVVSTSSSSCAGGAGASPPEESSSSSVAGDGGCYMAQMGSAMGRLNNLVAFVDHVRDDHRSPITTTSISMSDEQSSLDHPRADNLADADHLRQETLQNMYKILTLPQAARGLLALGDYCQRLRALSSLWAARPREPA
uniref:DOG1 domain-containing protein n=1 Tax=Oryza punctata TaxID=4537 RepID=A0A0E0LRU6_ORYPU